MKKVLVLLLVVIFFHTCKKKSDNQPSSPATSNSNWSAVGGGVIGNILVGEIRSMCVYKNELYVCGSFDKAGNVSANNIAKWNGNNWSPLAEGLRSAVASDAYIRAMAVYNGELYIGGSFDSAGTMGGMEGIARWNGTSWNSVGGTPLYSNGWIKSLAVYNGELYVAGSSSVYPWNNIMRWNGFLWDSLGLGIGHTVYALAVHNGELYAGGEFDLAGGVATKHLAKWNGSVWSSPGGGVSGLLERVEFLQSFNGSLYAGGIRVYPNWSHNIFAWNGSVWSGAGLPNSDVSCLTVFNNKLYSGGLTGPGQINVISLSGTSWSNLGDDFDGHINCMTVYNGSLYVAGVFQQSGTLITNGIAKMN